MKVLELNDQFYILIERMKVNTRFVSCSISLANLQNPSVNENNGNLIHSEDHRTKKPNKSSRKQINNAITTNKEMADYYYLIGNENWIDNWIDMILWYDG